MQRLLDQLDSPDSMLLMYLADELPAADRARVEQMLQRDATLQARLDELRCVQDAVSTAMRQMDSTQPLPGAEASAIRQVARNIRQWHANRAALAERPQVAALALRFPWWSYPLTAAAMVTFALLIWWANSSKAPSPVASDIDLPDTSVAQVAPELVFTRGPQMHQPQFVALDDRTDLTELEHELQAVRTLRDWLQ